MEGCAVPAVWSPCLATARPPSPGMAASAPHPSFTDRSLLLQPKIGWVLQKHAAEHACIGLCQETIAPEHEQEL